MPDELDERLKRLDKIDEHQEQALWQLHRKWCLKMATRLGATSPEQAIEYAEKLGNTYILRPPGPVIPPEDDDEPEKDV